jgi:hypothetical protein
VGRKPVSSQGGLGRELICGSGWIGGGGRPAQEVSVKLIDGIILAELLHVAAEPLVCSSVPEFMVHGLCLVCAEVQCLICRAES